MEGFDSLIVVPKSVAPNLYELSRVGCAFMRTPRGIPMNSLRHSGNVLHAVRKVSAGGRGWQGFVVLVVQGNHLLDDCTESLENNSFVATVAAAIHQAWGAAHITLVFFRPFDDLRVSGAFVHDLDSSIARRLRTNQPLFRFRH